MNYDDSPEVVFNGKYKAVQLRGTSIPYPIPNTNKVFEFDIWEDLYVGEYLTIYPREGLFVVTEDGR